MYAVGKKALGLCDVCGFEYKLSQLKFTVVNRVRTSIRACPTCWEPDHPQLQAGKLPVVDYEALRDPRPETYPEGLRNITWGWHPVYALEAKGQLGTVTVSTP